MCIRFPSVESGVSKRMVAFGHTMRRGTAESAHTDARLVRLPGEYVQLNVTGARHGAGHDDKAKMLGSKYGDV